jgi:hypothetical protein
MKSGAAIAAAAEATAPLQVVAEGQNQALL